MPLRAFLFVIVILANVQVLFAQAYIGQRETINYEKKQYNAGTQNWKIKQDAQGRMYFANNEGVLVYDGAYWQLYPLPNKTIVWSIEFGNDKRLYAGGQDEIGYFSPDKNGLLTFTSLKNLLPKADQKFSDIWDIVCNDGDIFFRSRTRIFRYSNNQITIYPAYSAWLYMGLHQKQLIVHDEQKGVLVYKDGSWETLIAKSLLPNGFYITSISPFNKTSSLITTAKNGVFILTGNQLKPWVFNGLGIDNGQHFSNAVQLDANSFLISTYSNGIYQVNRDGTVVDNISKKDGLQNSNVHTLLMDNNHNIWLGLDNGIDFIAYNNAVKHINPTVFKDGGGFSMAMYKSSLYFALSNGIYQLPINPIADLSYTRNNFRSLSEGLSWNLSVVNGSLLAGSDDGFSEIKNDKLVPVDKSGGFWLFHSLSKKADSSLIAAGNYYGVRLFEHKDAAFIDKGSVGNFKESARYLEIDSNNTIWTSHPYRGVYKLSLNSQQAKVYTQAEGLPSTLNNFVFKIRNRVVVATEKGVYEYNRKTDRFMISAEFKSIFGTRSLRYLKQDPAGNIWFVQGKSMAVVDYSHHKPNIINFPELTGRILSGFENVYPINDNNVFVSGENGFYHINYAKYKENIHPLQIYIRKVKAIANTDSLLFGGYFGHVNDDGRQSAASTPSLSYLWNSLHFEYSSPIFEEQSNVEYSYFLDGFDKEWSDWSKKSEKDYTNLPAGNYTFKIRARNHQNNESPVSTYSFTINPPWYQTLWAYGIYILLVISLLYFFYKLQEKRHVRNQEKELLLQRQKNEEEQKRMAYLHQLELEIAETEVVKLRNEKLETEIEYKNSELASAAMNLVQKKEFLLKVKEELQRLNKSGQDMVDAVEIKKILRLLSEEKKINEEWEQFSVHFNKVHADFLTVLKERYPTINQQELKLCAYLIMNLSSKEIAQLMAISVRGVEISRYRLRKKLLIPTEVNLFEFLFDIQREIMK
ncbi:Y_Y_Y domain-containing protein [Mucilaginibacter pineti]|uniref:Y_Y_Y domain-containing protein n=1 Tax=Mucilaginibacter pineti TaxID=1391627 RepID=A0A1G7AVW9_9SPHI|nr:triple tyrosine motif-containing protein [Mucilaginibacter pineti]SDE18943.1 Y_Y_Y domain-containing protein [Mucilaginibacter pineti]